MSYKSIAKWTKKDWMKRCEQVQRSLNYELGIHAEMEQEIKRAKEEAAFLRKRISKIIHGISKHQKLNIEESVMKEIVHMFSTKHTRWEKMLEIINTKKEER